MHLYNQIFAAINASKAIHEFRQYLIAIVNDYLFWLVWQETR